MVKSLTHGQFIDHSHKPEQCAAAQTRAMAAKESKLPKPLKVNSMPELDIQCESKKSLPEDLWEFFQNGWEFFNQILHAYYAFPSTLDYEFLFDYLQL